MSVSSSYFMFNIHHYKGLWIAAVVALFCLCAVPAEAGKRSTSSTLRITSQPTSLSLDEGASTTLSLRARSSLTISYAWLKNGSVIGNSRNLSLSNLKVADAGTYSCRVSDGVTTLNCTPFTLTVIAAAPPVVTSDLILNSQPANASLYEGKAITFQMQASSSKSMTYAWFKDGVAIGANSNSFAISNAATSNAGTYGCQVTDGIKTIACNPFTLTINNIVRITQQPVSQMIDEGVSTSLAVTATGTAPISYQWYYNNAPVAGATAKTLTLANATPAANGAYYCVVSNPGSTVNSSAATLSVVAAPKLGTALISWIQPTKRENGSSLDASDIAGYEVYHAIGSTGTLSKLVSLNANELSVVVNDLELGNHYFALATVDSTGTASKLSASFMVTIK